MKIILVPTDFSENAENALHYAINLTTKMHAKIILLHSFHIDYTNAYVSENLIEKDIADAQAKSNSQLKALYNKVSHHAKHPIECISTENFAVDTVLDLINQNNVDIVIMGTQGANGKLGRQIFGTNSSKVIEKAKCPVIIVPEGTKNIDLKTIAYATEYLNSDITCLQNMAEIAKLFDATINIIHVSLFNDDQEQKAMEAFKAKVLKNISYINLTF
jgi:nucleotide-binding universal stress UspA family protein